MRAAPRLRFGRWFCCVVVTSALAGCGDAVDDRTVSACPTLAGDGGAHDPTNPFRAGQDWRGSYACPQGETHLDLRILATAGDDVSATFDFDWFAGDESGAYCLSGDFDPDLRTATLDAGSWLVDPGPTWTAVSLSGTVWSDGIHYTGTIADPDCGDFKVTLAP